MFSHPSQLPINIKHAWNTIFEKKSKNHEKNKDFTYIPIFLDRQRKLTIFSPNYWLVLNAVGM